MSIGRFLVLLVLVFPSAEGQVSSLTFELPDNDKMCFYELFKMGQKYNFHYKVVKGGKNDVDASLESPNGKILYKETKKRGDTFTFEASRGVFKFCFSNEFSTITHKVVYFHISPENLPSLSDEAGVLKKPTVHTHMEASMEAIHRVSTTVVNYQTEYRLFEARGRHKAEELHKRVQYWSLGELVIIMMCGFGQVMILKTFFAEKKESSKKTQQAL